MFKKDVDEAKIERSFELSEEREILLDLFNTKKIPNNRITPILDKLYKASEKTSLFIQEVKLYRPIFGIEEPCIRFTDFPFSTNSYKKDEKIVAMYNASVIIYVFDASTPFNYSHMQEIKILMELGYNILFVFNRRDSYNDEDISQTIQDLQCFMTGHKLNIHIENLKNPTKFSTIKKAVCAILASKMKTSTTLFLKELERYLSALYSLVTRIVDHHVDCQLESAKGIRNHNSWYQRRTSIIKQIHSLETNSIMKITEISNKLKQEALHILDVYTHKKKDKVNRLELDQDIDIEQRPFYKRLFKARELTKYEREIMHLLDAGFQEKLFSKFRIFLIKESTSFRQYIIDESERISANVEELKQEQLKTLGQTNFLDGLESYKLKNKSPIKKTLPATILVIGGFFGTSGLLGSILSGMISLSVITGGASGVFAFLTSAALLKVGYMGFKSKDPQNERELQNAALDSFKSDMKININNHDFSGEVEYLHKFLELTINYLQLNMLEISNILDVSKCKVNMSYESLCDYLKMKNDINTLVESLNNEMKLQAKHVKRTVIKNHVKKSRHPKCFICNHEIHKCNRLCRKCDYVIGSKQCPHCIESGSWIAEKIRFRDKHFESILSKVAPFDDTDNLEYMDQNLEAKVRVQKYQESVKLFCQWFNNKLNQDITVKELKSSVTSFIFRVIENYRSYKGGDIPGEVELAIASELQNMIFSEEISTGCMKMYRAAYRLQDEEFLEICLTKGDSFVNHYLKESDIEQVVQIISSLPYLITPCEKLGSLKHVSRIINENSSERLGADEFWDIIAYIFVKSKPEYMVSEINFISDMLENLVEHDTEYLLTTFNAIANNFSSIFGDA